MKKQALSILSFFIFVCTNAQTTFNNTYNITSFADGFVPVATNGINYYSSGNGFVSGAYRKNTITEIGSDGTLLRSGTFGNDSCLYGTGYGLIIDDTSFIYLGAETNSIGTFPYVAKLNNNFDTVWTSKKWGLIEGVFLGGIKDKNNYLFIGELETGSGSNLFDIVVLKTDSNGNIIWIKILASAKDEIGFSIDTITNGGYIIAGQQFNAASSADIYVARLDSLGNLIVGWPKIFSSPTSDGAWAKTLYDESFLIYGSWNPGINGKAHLRKLNQSGTTIWVKDFDFPKPDIYSAYFGCVTENENNDLVLGGVYYDSIINNPIGFILKTDSNGNEYWRRDLKIRTNDHYIYGIVPGIDGGYVLSGTVFSDGPNTQDGWLVKVDSMGCIISGCAIGIEEENKYEGIFKIYPNPSNGEFIVENISSYHFSEKVHFTLFDFTGNEVFSSEIKDQLQSNLQIKLPSSCYFGVLKSNGDILQTFKLIIEN